MDASSNQQLISFSLSERIKQPVGGGDDRIQHPFVQCQMFTVWPCVALFLFFLFYFGFLVSKSTWNTWTSITVPAVFRLLDRGGTFFRQIRKFLEIPLLFFLPFWMIESTIRYPFLKKFLFSVVYWVYIAQLLRSTETKSVSRQTIIRDRSGPNNYTVIHSKHGSNNIASSACCVMP